MTDANLLVGHLDPDAPLAGDVRLDVAAAEQAIERLARELDLDRDECAAGILRVANAEMLRALRVVTVQRGIDPREYALLCFGGAGPLHAAAIAEELGIGEILCPRASGVLAALGLVVAPRRRDAQRSVLLSGDELDADRLAGHAAALADEARAKLGAGDEEAELRAVYALRYRGQAFELPVTGPLNPDPSDLRAAFDALHEARYGYYDPSATLELVTIRISATLPGTRVPLHVGRKGPHWHLTSKTPGAESREHPRRIALPESTLIAPEGWDINDLGDVIRLRRSGRGEG